MPLHPNETQGKDYFKPLLDLGTRRAWKYLEIRGEPPTDDAVSSSRFYGHILDLRCGIERLKKKFSSAARGAITKAEAKGLKVRVVRTWDGMSAFYRLHSRTRRRHGLPPQSLSFFKTIHAEMVETGSAFVILASLGSVATAAAVFFCGGNNAIYKFAASDERLQEFRGSNLVMWEGIKHLTGSGMESLHLGRTTLTNLGLRRFKRAWGAKEEIIDYYTFNLVENRWVRRPELSKGFQNVVFKRLPSALSRLAGAILYPHLD
jgi:lipid II:glycine glycyltransferase (peptidoglycan interpeptide bridge formation enzyme)